MKKTVFALFFIFLLNTVYSQDMTVTKLGQMLEKVSDSIVSQKTNWRFIIKQTPFIAVADSTHNRMRIISPITSVNRLTEELKTASLIANFHTALDVKYAISDDILWAVFIHPLKELSEEQVLDAIGQVYYANITFGSTFSSTSLVFPGKAPEKNSAPKRKLEKLPNKF